MKKIQNLENKLKKYRENTKKASDEEKNAHRINVDCRNEMGQMEDQLNEQKTIVITILLLAIVIALIGLAIVESIGAYIVLAVIVIVVILGFTPYLEKLILNPIVETWKAKRLFDEAKTKFELSEDEYVLALCKYGTVREQENSVKQQIEENAQKVEQEHKENKMRLVSNLVKLTDQYQKGNT